MVRLNDLLNVPFVSGGRNCVTGLDCWGLVMEVYRRFGLTVPDFVIDAFAMRAIDSLAGDEAQKRLWEQVYTPSNTDAPLVVLMKVHPVYVTHAGVYLGGNRIIHTMERTGVIVSKTATLEKIITGYYRRCSQ